MNDAAMHFQAANLEKMCEPELVITVLAVLIRKLVNARTLSVEFLKKFAGLIISVC